jgi:beta-N-acetylhexosaminidase
LVQWRRLILALIFFTTAPIRSQEVTPETKPETKAESTEAASPPKAVPTAAEELLKKLSLSQKVGQLLILGFPGKIYSNFVDRLLKQIQPGAVIVFGRNVKDHRQIASLNREMQLRSSGMNSVPLMIMVDQEGGAVARIKTQPLMPSALALGTTDDIKLIEQVGEQSGKLLFNLGFNVNLAPVLDVGDPRRQSFIGNRSFSGDPQIVAQMGLAFATGLWRSGVLPTAKHFPGHGGISQDSHKKMPSKLLSLEDLEKSDLVPFRKYKELAHSAVMVAHLALPNIDDSGLPAAFSPWITTEMLQKTVGYQGLIITDDIEMAGAKFAGGIGERAVKAVEAGCDMIMVAWSRKRQTAAYNGLLKAVKQGRLTEERINASVLKILEQKLALPAPPKRRLNLKEFNTTLTSTLEDLKRVNQRVVRMNFEKTSAGLTPPVGTDEQPAKAVVFSADPSFFAAFEKAAPGKATFYQLSNASLAKFPDHLRHNSDATAIYYATGSVTARAMRDLPTDLKARILLVNGTYPGAIQNPEAYQRIIQLNSLEPESGFWLGSLLFPEVQKPATDLLADPPREPTATEPE